MDIATLQAQEAEAYSQIQEDAAQASQGAISRASLAAASAALERVAADAGRGSIGEPAADLRALRTDPHLLRALNADLAAESRRLLQAAPGWVAAGWTMEAEGQAEIIMEGAPGVQISVELSEAERAALATFPVQGYGLGEVVEHLIYVLRRDFLGALGRGLAQAQTPGGVMVPLVQVSDDHAARVGRAAGECFLAGTQAARSGFGHELARTLGGAP